MLYRDLEPVWSAFWDLHGCRPAGFGASPIPLSEIDAYFRIHRIDDPEDRQDWLALIAALDRHWLDWHAKQDTARAKRR